MEGRPQNLGMTVLVYESAEDVQRKIIELLEQIDGVAHKIIVQSPKDLTEKIQKEKPHIAFIDDSLSPFESERAYEGFRSIKCPFFIMTSKIDSRGLIPEGCRGRIFKPSSQFFETDLNRFKGFLRPYLDLR